MDRKSQTVANTQKRGNSRTGAIVGIIVALILLSGGVVAMYIIWRRYQNEIEKQNTPPKPPKPVSPPPPLTPIHPEDPGKTEPPTDPTKPPPESPVKKDPAADWPWIGKNYVLTSFYTERDNVNYKLETEWIPNTGSEPHKTIRLTLVPILTYIDWKDILSGKGGQKLVYFKGGAKQDFLKLIQHQTFGGNQLWKSATKYTDDDDGKTFEFMLTSKDTEEEGRTPLLIIQYNGYDQAHPDPPNNILDVQNIVFEANPQ